MLKHIKVKRIIFVYLFNKMKNNEFSVVIVGSVNCDITSYVPSFPLLNQTISAADATLAVGGKGLNQAVAAAQSGSTTAMIACVGNDSFGEMAKNYLIKNQVDVSGLRVTKSKKTGTANILVNNEGDNMIAVYPGANGDLNADDINTNRSKIENAKVILTQLECPISTIKLALSSVKKSTTIRMLNPAPAAKECLPLFKWVDVLTPNETETEILTGIYPYDNESAKKAANILHELGIDGVVITLGQKGCFVSERHQNLLIEAIKVKAVDPTGAGDVFNGILASCLSTDMNLLDSAKLAGIGASLSVTKMTAEGAAPTMDAILRFAQQNT